MNMHENMLTTGCIWSQRQAIFRSQVVTLHLSDFRDRCECISLRWHPLIRHYILDKRVILVRIVWHKQRRSKAVTAHQGEGRNCGKGKSRFSPVKYNFSQIALCAIGCVWPSWTLYFRIYGEGGKKKSPLEIKMQNHTFRLVISPLLIWVTKQLGESWADPGAWFSVWMYVFSSPEVRG